MKKARSSYDLALLPTKKTSSTDLKFKNPMKYQSSTALYPPNQQHQPTSKAMASSSSTTAKGNNSKSDDSGKHKVVIYFSDAYNNICNKVNGVDDGNSDIDRHRFDNNMQSSSSSKVPASPSPLKKNSSKEFMAQLKTVLEEKSKFTNKFTDSGGGSSAGVLANKFKPTVPEKPTYPSTSSSSTNMLLINQPSSSVSSPSKRQQQQQQHEMNGKSSKLLPSFIESIDENNVIKLKIEQNFRKASELVSLISSLPKKNKKLKNVDSSRGARGGSGGGGGHETSSIHELNFSHEGEMECIEEICSEDDEEESEEDDDDGMSEPDEGYFYDWSFVQEWRSR